MDGKRKASEDLQEDLEENFENLLEEAVQEAFAELESLVDALESSEGDLDELALSVLTEAIAKIRDFKRKLTGQ